MPERFGGDWTEKKLEYLRAYFKAYHTALKKKNFHLLYVDAFSGSGYREVEDDDSGTKKFLKGSPNIALEFPFKSFFFIEKNKDKCAKLELIKEQNKDKNIYICNKDANEIIPKICDETDWRGLRAIFFLDPFAMQVEWEMVKSIAKTEAIDLWVLFPVMAVNRLLTTNGKIPQQHESKLDMIFGTRSWEDAFYQKDPQTSLLKDEGERLKKVADFSTIKQFYADRLKEIFAGVADNPLPLRNSKNSILFYLCFAVGNKGKGKELALRMAKCILGKNK